MLNLALLSLLCYKVSRNLILVPFLLQDCSFPAYFYTQPMATGPGFYDNLCPQSWQDGSAATWTLQDPHQQSKFFIIVACYSCSVICVNIFVVRSLRLPRKLNVSVFAMLFIRSMLE